MTRYKNELLSLEPMRAQSVLNERAALGWRLVSAFPVKQGAEMLLYCVMEREEADVLVVDDPRPDGGVTQQESLDWLERTFPEVQEGEAD